MEGAEVGCWAAKFRETTSQKRKPKQVAAISE
jgi:hypothetical protein